MNYPALSAVIWAIASFISMIGSIIIHPIYLFTFIFSVLVTMISILVVIKNMK